MSKTAISLSKPTVAAPSKSQSDKDFASGASLSLKKTIKEIENLINKRSNTDAGTLRGELHDMIKKLNKEWFKYGFSHGYSDACKRSESGAAIPKTAIISRKLRYGLDQDKPSELKFKVTVHVHK